MRRERFGSGTRWEERAGYSRAVRVGDRVLVAGTTGTVIAREGGEGALAGVDEYTLEEDVDGAYREALSAMRRVVQAVEEAGASVGEVVRTRMFVTDASKWRSVARAHREVFGEAGPVSTLVEVSALVEEDMFIEVEAEAIVNEKEAL